MKEMKICYADINNMGDQLNKDLIEDIFKCRVIPSKHGDADMIAIGSGLKTYTYDKSLAKNTKKKIINIFKPQVYVWGTGFIEYPKMKEQFYKKKIKFLAVRGNITKKRVEEILGEKLDIPTGDGGLLSSYMLKHTPKKEYDVGIIAHFKEKDHSAFKKLLRKFPNSVFIDVQDTPMNVIKKIAKCRVIISSSLHGLIISDSLNIPNIHIVVSNNLLGDGYKFDDYYSAFGLKHEFIREKDIDDLTLDTIKKNYGITKEMVDKKKRQLIECFPCDTRVEIVKRRRQS